MEYKDYYKILGVSKNATEKEIKQAYRKMARKYHPDVNPGNVEAEERFKEINEAHEVLTDPAKRQKYDQFGVDWQRYQQAGAQAGGFDWAEHFARAGGTGRSSYGSGGPHVEYGDASEFFGGQAGSGFSDFFESLFGSMGRGQTAGAWQTNYRNAPPRRAPDYEHKIDVTLEEAFNGSTRILEMDNRRIEVKIPPGVKTGSKIRVAGEIGKGIAGQQAGDLLLKVRVLPHKTFERKGDDLYCDVPVDIYTAALGGEVTVPTLKGGKLSLRIPAETQNGRTFRLHGQGMPVLRSPSERGDLFAKVQLVLPTPLTEKEKTEFQELAELRR